MGITDTKISLILPSFCRAELLDTSLSSIKGHYKDFDLEIIVVNDGIEDRTQEVCDKHKELNIKYVFSGQRNVLGNKIRVAGFALNIGVRQSRGDIIILSCAEIYHLNDCLLQTIMPLLKYDKIMTTPRFMYFDDVGVYTDYVYKLEHCQGCVHFKDKPVDVGWNFTKNIYGIKMPYLMGMRRNEYVEIGGYDEDFTGYACDDNDFVDRLIAKGLTYYYTDALCVHLYHTDSNNTFAHPDNAPWVYNNNLYLQRKGDIVRNKDREWGKI